MNQASRIDHGFPVPAGGFEDDENGLVQKHPGSIDLRRLWFAIYRNRYLILGVFVLTILAAVVLTLLMRPKYAAVASVQIEQQAAKVLGSEDSEPVAVLADADRFLQTQLDILKSRALAARVVAALHLDRGDEFVTKMGVHPVLVRLGQDAHAVQREQILKLINDNLKVNLPHNSRVAQISFISPNPALAADVANDYADNFIISNLRRRFDTTAYARNFLERRLNEIRQRLQVSERAMIDYARTTGLIDASNAASSGDQTTNTPNGPKSLTVAELVQLDSASTQAQTARIAAEGRWNTARKTPLMELPEVLASPTVQELSQQKAQLAAAYEEERQRRKVEYPTMIQEAARITELDRQITQIATTLRNSIHDAYRVALHQETALDGEVKALKAATLAEQDQGIRYNILKRDVDTNRALYDGLLQRYKAVSAEAGVTSNNITIVDRADIPLKPTSPKMSLNLAAALLLASALSTAVVFGREKLDDRIRSAEDVPNKLGLPLLATIPILPEGMTPMEALELPRSDLSEAYQSLRSALELSSSEGPPRTLLVTSSRPSEGKSTASFATARSFARLGKRALLVDCDMRRPSLHRVLGLSNLSGLSSLLAHQQQIEVSTQPTGVENLDFIASGPLPPNPAELLNADALGELLSRLRQLYDIVVLDGPPVLGLADAVQLASAVEGTVFVVEANTGHFGGVKTSLRRIASAQSPVLGVILNKFDPKQASYNYSYSYNYAYRYKQEPD